MKKILLSVLVLAALIPAIFAQTESTPSSGGGGGGGTSVLPISSQDELRNYALPRSVRGTISLDSPSMDWNFEGSKTYVEVTGLYAEDVLGKLMQAEFVFRLKNGGDLVTGHLYLFDAAGHNLFYGRAEFKAGEKPAYSIWMQNIPLLGNVQAAEVLALNPDGTSSANRHPLDVSGGKQLMFRPWLAGAPNGLLSVKFTDGTLAVYLLAAPKAEPVGSSTVDLAGYKIEGHYVFRNSDPHLTVKVMETEHLPTVFLELTGADIQNIVFDVTGLVVKNGMIVREKPVSVLVYIAGEDSPAIYPMPKDSDFLIISLAPRSYRVRFEWANFGQRDALYTGPMDGGGKG